MTRQKNKPTSYNIYVAYNIANKIINLIYTYLYFKNIKLLTFKKRLNLHTWTSSSWGLSIRDEFMNWPAGHTRLWCAHHRIRTVYWRTDNMIIINYTPSLKKDCRRRNFSVWEKNQPWYIVGKVYMGYKIITIIYACLARRTHSKRVVFEKMWVDIIYLYIFCSAPSICFSLYVLWLNYVYYIVYCVRVHRVAAIQTTTIWLT